MLEKKEGNKSKFNKTFSYYYKQLYKNFENNEILQERIVNIDIIANLIEKNWIKQYKIYLQPTKWLPDILIKNPWVFFLFCTIHWFLPNIDWIYIKNWINKINIEKYDNMVFITRLIHLLFIKWFDFVLYDMINKFLKDNEIENIFKENNLQLLSEWEILSLIKIIQDIKKLWFDIHKHHFHDKLWKLSNKWIFSENIFLEIWMKYENQIREYLWYDSTYIKPASYKDDTEYKTDFNLIYSLNKKNKKYLELPIQFTVSLNKEKLLKVEEYFLKSEHNVFWYIQVGWNLKNNFTDIEKEYQNWILNSKKRENLDPLSFPFFINEQKENTIESIIIYFYLHQILKHKKAEIITKLDININWIDFSRTWINKEIQKKCNNKVIENIYTIKYKRKEVWKIILLEKT